jgi:ABC-type sugar transport system permease subunit
MTGAAVAPPVAAATPRSRFRAQARAAWRHRALYLFVAPFGLITCLFGLWPVVMSVVVAFRDSYTALGDAPVFVGLDNFRHVLGDPSFVSSLWATLLFTAISVPLNVALALALALFLSQDRLARGMPLFVFALLLPVVTPDVASLVVWKWMFDQSFGAVNAALLGLGLPPFAGITRPVPAFISLLVVELWHHVGFFALIFLSNIALLDPALSEAARMDGAGAWARFRNVTLPQLRPAVVINTVYATIEFLKTFTAVVVITKGGPNFATNFVSYYAYTKFSAGEYGESTAMATLLFAIVLAISALLYRVSARANPA